MASPSKDPTNRRRALEIGLASFLLLFCAAAAGTLLTGAPERSELQELSGEIRDVQLRGAKRRRHVEFYIGRHHLQYDGLNQVTIGRTLKPGMAVTALVRPHAYRQGVLQVEELSAGGRLLVSMEARWRQYRLFGYVALAFAVLLLGYLIHLLRSRGGNAAES